jgi:hypothetical protein
MRLGAELGPALGPALGAARDPELGAALGPALGAALAATLALGSFLMGMAADMPNVNQKFYVGFHQRSRHG